MNMCSQPRKGLLMTPVFIVLSNVSEIWG